MERGDAGMTYKHPATTVGWQLVNATDATAARTAIGSPAQGSPTAVKTSAYTATAGEIVIVDASAGGFTVSLPGSPPNGTLIWVKKIDVTGNAITVQRTGTDVFNQAGGGSALQVYMPSQIVTMQYQDGIWYVINNSYGQPALDAFYTPLNASELKNRNGDTFLNVSQAQQTNDTFLTMKTQPNSAASVSVGTGSRGTSQNVNLRFDPYGGGQVQIGGDFPTIACAETNKQLVFRVNGNGQFVMINDSQPNSLLFRGANTDSPPSIIANGSQNDVSLNLATKGNGKVLANYNPVVTTVSVPESATSTGTVGTVAYDSSFVYVCVATNTWRRAALSTWT